MSERVVQESDVPDETWSDARGELGFRTLFGGPGRETEALTLGTTELPWDGWLGLHRHDPAEVYYVLSGEGVVSVDGQEHAVAAGSAVFIPGGAEHGVRTTSETPLRIVYAFAVGSFAEVEYRFSAPDAG